MFGADVGIVELARDEIGATKNALELSGKRNDLRSGECLAGRFFLQAELGQGFLFETDVFQEDAAQTGVFQENCQQQVFRLNSGVPGRTRDITSFFQAVTGVNGQFLAEIGFKHRKNMSISIVFSLTGTVNGLRDCPAL